MAASPRVGTVPAAKWDAVPLSETTRPAMNLGLAEVALALEQMLPPASGSDAVAPGPHPSPDPNAFPTAVLALRSVMGPAAGRQAAGAEARCPGGVRPPAPPFPHFRRVSADDPLPFRSDESPMQFRLKSDPSLQRFLRRISDFAEMHRSPVCPVSASG